MKKNLPLFLCLFIVSITFAQTSKTEIYIIGTVHEKSKILDPEKLYSILNDIKPDIILQENDTQQIKQYFDEIRPNSNEQSATILYLKKYPNTLNLPFEFEGRNQYRINHGMVPTDNLTIKLLDSLYDKDLLNLEEKQIYKSYLDANAKLKDFSLKDFITLNSTAFDSVNKIRQQIQHKELPKISSNNKYFKQRFVVKPDGEKISYADGYQLWCNFWDLRNNSMAINVIKQANSYPGKRIVVLTGVQHKYYMKELLEKYYDGSYKILDYFK